MKPYLPVTKLSELVKSTLNMSVQMKWGRGRAVGLLSEEDAVRVFGRRKMLFRGNEWK